MKKGGACGEKLLALKRADPDLMGCRTTSSFAVADASKCQVHQVAGRATNFTITPILEDQGRGAGRGAQDDSKTQAASTFSDLLVGAPHSFSPLLLAAAHLEALIRVHTPTL